MAKRYPSDIAPFAAVSDDSIEAGAALRGLVPADAPVILFAPGPIAAPEGLEATVLGSMHQMVATETLDQLRIDDVGVLPLGAADVPDMQRLTALTRPGPFGPRTYLLGRYIGIRVAGELVAMAGERLRLPGYTEISAVCVHPDHRRKGYAQGLIGELVRDLTRQGITPFLHVISGNHPAIALYEQLRFTTRRLLYATAVTRARADNVRSPGPAAFKFY